MRISQRLIFIQVLFVVGLITFVVAWTVYRSNQTALFLKSSGMHNEKIIDMVISNNQEKINRPLYDNSEWDETVKYLTGQLEGFEKECLDPLLQTYEFNAIVAFDSTGKKQYTVNDSSDYGLNFLMDSLDVKKIITHESPKRHFFIRNNHHILEVFGASVVPTGDTTHSERPRGYLFFVKNWDHKTLHNLAILTRSNLVVQFRINTSESVENSANIVLRRLKDWNDRDIAVLRFSIDDPIVNEWKSSDRKSTFHTTIFGVFLIFFMAFVFRRWISKPLIKAHDELKYSDERFRQVSESTGEWIWEVNPEGLFTYSNTTTSTILGYDSDDLVGKKYYFELFEPDFREIRKTELLKLLERKGKIKDIVFPFLHKNKSRVLLQCNASPYYDVDGVFLGYRGTNLDITENQKTLENLKIALNQAEENDRLKTAFLNNISHEIRTPVHAVVGYSTLLEDSTNQPDKRKLYIDIIHSACNQLVSIIDDIISIATVEAGQEKVRMTDFELHRTLKNIHDQFQLKANEKGVTFLLNMPSGEEELNVHSDKTKLIQVLSNLLINAFKFTKQGSITFGYTCSNDQLSFYVKDTGIGIPKEMQSLIFERFRQADNTGIREYGGMGLGLSISKAYIELLNGSISLDSAPGKGSTFSFSIPLIQPKKVSKSEKVSSKKIKTEESADLKTILVAEDEDLNFLLINEMLSSVNWEILRTKNGVETVSLCKEHPEIGLVLMDIKMPEMDGYDATRLIREFRKDLPIIVQSAYIHEEGRRKAFEAGADDFITKPFDKEQFNRIIKRYTEKQKLIRTYNI